MGFIINRSAYHHYSKVSTVKVRDELAKDGKDSSLGAVVSIVSARVSRLIFINIIFSSIDVERNVFSGDLFLKRIRDHSKQWLELIESAMNKSVM